jgi:hypothetical protein
VPAGRDHHKRVPAGIETGQRRGDVALNHFHPRKASGIGEVFAIVDDGDLVVQQLRHLSKGQRDMPTAGNDEPRPRDDRLDQQLSAVLERHEPGRTPLERIGQQPPSAIRQPLGLFRTLDDAVAFGRDRSTFYAQARAERDGSFSWVVETGAQPFGPVAPESGGVRLDVNPHRAAAHQAGVPGERFGQIVRAKRRPALHEHSTRLRNRVALDASAAQGASELAAIVDDQAGADDLRRTALRPNDRGDDEVPPVALELEHPL